MRARRLTGLALAFAIGAAPAWAQSPAPQAPQGSAAPSAEGQGAATRGLSEAGRPEAVTRPGLGGTPSMDAMNLPGPVDPDIYRVGPGDVLVLQLWGKVSRILSIEVGPEGQMLVPGAGSIRADGRTLRQVRAQVLDLLQQQFRGVSMDVRLARPRVFRVYVTGQVAGPGAVLATGSSRVADILAPGSFTSGASTRRIEVIHRDGRREIADLGLFLATGSAPLNPWLLDGDVVHVPPATEYVYIQGAVARPGTYELGERDSLLTLLRIAGDPIPSAALEHALLVRWKDAFVPESLFINLEDVYARRVNPPLAEGERLYVYYVPRYHLQHDAVIVGEVERPGPFPIVEGRTHISDLVRAAEGFLPNADLTSIRVHRRGSGEDERDPELERLLRLSRAELTASEYALMRTKLAGLREDYRVDWNRMEHDPVHLDLLLRDGDIVRVERLVQSVRVDGQVRRPGLLAYQPGLTVNDYIRLAGGFADRASASKTRVTRSANGQTLSAKSVRTLDPGDFVWVPEKPDVSAWQQAQTLLSSLAYVATIVIAIRSVR